MLLFEADSCTKVSAFGFYMFTRRGKFFFQISGDTL